MPELTPNAPTVDDDAPAVQSEACASCGCPVEDLDQFCPACGAEQAAAAEVVNESVEQKHFRCENCGAEVAVDPDQRSYRVSFDRVSTDLPGFACEWSLVKGATQLRQVYEQAALTTELFRHRPFTRIKQLQHLLSTAQIDAEFYWKQPVGEPGTAELAQHA